MVRGRRAQQKMVRNYQFQDLTEQEQGQIYGYMNGVLARRWAKRALGLVAAGDVL